jgi:hypothetical protein
MSDSDLSLVRARRAAIKREMESLEEEDEELQTAERVLARLQASKVVKPAVAITAGNGAHATSTAPTKSSGRMSQPDYVIGTLKAVQNPWVDSPVALQGLIKTLHNVEIPTNSFHPILHHLRADGVIVRDGSRLALAERVKVGTH